MHVASLRRWQHSHAFGQDRKHPGEMRTLIVIVITGVMMVIEVAAGIVFGSMALLADGLHMGSHAVALGINAFAYVHARKHAHDESYSFGTGKVNTLGGFTGAVLLAGFALMMVLESGNRFISPVPIAFNHAILVAVIGLLVNGLSALILDHGRARGAEEGHGLDMHDHHHHDHNLVAAYLHVLADALTSLLAILALTTAKYFGTMWMDPAMGVVGAILVARWSVTLVKSTSGILLDRTAPDEIVDAVRASIESKDDNRIADLHVWSVGMNLYSAIISVVTHDPRPPEHYKALLPDGVGLVHVAVEVHRCGGQSSG
jgi:cation diffusion facilitator family transporter